MRGPSRAIDGAGQETAGAPQRGAGDGVGQETAHASAVSRQARAGKRGEGQGVSGAVRKTARARWHEGGGHSRACEGVGASRRPSRDGGLEMAREMARVRQHGEGDGERWQGQGRG